MKRKPEHVAWLVLSLSLLTCCALTFGVPAGTWALVNAVTVEPKIEVRLRAGILKAFSRYEQESDARVVSLDGRPLEEGATVIVGPESVGLMTVGMLPDRGTPMFTLQLYANAHLHIDRARLPRFSFASRNNELYLHLHSGRIQILVEEAQPRSFELRVRTPDGETLITTPGTYSLEKAKAETRVSVAAGSATVATADGRRAIQLSAGQRTTVRAPDQLAGVLSPVRNLVRNSTFQTPLSPDWKVETLVMQGSPVTGTAKVSVEEGRPALFLERLGSGIGWGRTGVTQVINEDVLERQSLQLRIDFRILYQEIPVCGGEGSECPLMVRIDYRTRDGRDASWIQGFYAVGTPTGASLPDYIRSNPQNKHIARRLNTLEPPFESENLLAILPDMQLLKSITLYAEGHAVRTRINSVELLLQE